jgi:hypothetical protein
MLHALKHRKTRFHLRYLGHREEGEPRVCEEDEITSTILGPLVLLDPREIGRFWRNVLQSTAHSAFLPTGDPIDAKLQFWESRSCWRASTVVRIEPDLFVELDWGGGQKRWLLVELKWRAALSGDDQLKRQWCDFLSDVERADALHLFLAPEISEGLAAQERSDVWRSSEGSRLVLLSWLTVRGTFKRLKSEPAAVGRWASLADSFLERLQIRSFQGFRSLSLPDELKQTMRGRFIFWNPYAVKGLGSLGGVPKLATVHRHRALFFGAIA